MWLLELYPTGNYLKNSPFLLPEITHSINNANSFNKTAESGNLERIQSEGEPEIVTI